MSGTTFLDVLPAAIATPCCGDTWVASGPDAASSTHLVGIIACARCGADYSLRLDVRRMPGKALKKALNGKASRSADATSETERERTIGDVFAILNTLLEAAA